MSNPMTTHTPGSTEPARKVCLCCGNPAGNGTYDGRPVCFNCYDSGKLLDCLAAEMSRNMVTPATTESDARNLKGDY